MPDIIDANTSNVSTLTTDLNVFPYYDDFDALNNYYRLLFRPGRAVQARELTQIQSTLQNQIAKFGQHIFKEGSIVIPGGFNLFTANTDLGGVNYVKVKDTDDSNNDIVIDNFKGLTVTGATSNVTAVIRLVADGSESSSNTKTIYVDYTAASNSNSSIKTFQADEVLTTNIGNLVAINTAPTGKGSTFKITQGVVYAKEHFIDFSTQEVIVDRYNTVPTAKVGFLIEESIVQSSSDATLLDPALGSSNYAAPGADRLKLNPILSVTGIDDPIASPDFVTLFTIRNGLVTTIFERSQYNILRNELAKRTYDESGDYYVRGHDITIREHLNDGVNEGRYLDANVGNSQLLSVEVSPGLSYVKGYEVGTLETVYLETEKALDYENVNSQIVSTAMGQYLTLKEFRGDWTMDTGLEVNLYDAPNDWLTASNTSPTGNNIGTARIKTVEYSSGTLGTPAAQVNAYLFDIRMTGSNNFSSTKSIYFNQTGSADLAGDVVLTGNSAVLQDVALNPLLYYTGSDATKTLAETGTSDTTFSYRSTSDETLASGGTFSISLPAGADQFPYGTTTLSDSQKREIFINFNEDATVNVTAVSGGTALSNTDNVLTGSDTTFTDLNVGDKIEISGIGGTHRIVSITDDETLTVADTFGTGTIAGNVINKVYKTGDLVDLTTLGIDAGIERSVSATSSQLDIDLKETFDASKSVTVSFRVAETEAIAASKTLRPNRFVRINVAAQSSSTGPFNLGVSDVFQIREIRQKTGSTFTANSEGTVVTTNFRLDNGQRDAFYNHASITPKTTLAGNEYLLVELDYFEPSFAAGQGFFSVDSYPVNDGSSANTDISTAEIPIYKSPTSGRTYNLRNYMDFRPVFDNTAADSTTVGSSTEDPATSSALTFDANGLRLPAPSSTATIDYSYYLARKDVVVVNKDGQFGIVRGTPATTPRTPLSSDNDMTLATITLAPYPSISPQYSKTLNRKDIGCSVRKTSNIRHTMKDIGVIKNRVSNLEYYVSLNALEKAALDFRVLDENGIDRFKNGIFVDTFAGHELGASDNEDYNIVVDKDEKSIRPVYTMDSVNYNFVSGTNIQRHVTGTGDIITLSYTEVPFITQNNVTTTRNTERNTYRFSGKVTLTPELDFWVDTQYAPDQSFTFGPQDEEVTEMQGGITPEWNAWQTHITGYRVYRGNSNDERDLIGEYSTLQEANRVVNQFRNSTGATIETLTESNRTGTQEILNVETDTQSIGDRVIDVSLQPYIKPQSIEFYARGLKPFARHYIYFDSIDMSQYSTPLTQAEYTGDADFVALGFTEANEGDPFVANEDGEVYGRLRLPDDPRFVVGSKRFVIADSPSNSEEDITSFSEGYFHAQGVFQEKQETILSLRYVTLEEKILSDSRTDSSSGFIRPDPPRPPTPRNIDNSWTRSCFVAGMLVTMADGSKKKIENVKLGEFIKGKNGDNKVLEYDHPMLDNPSREPNLYSINDSIPFVTPEHPFMTRKGWKSPEPTETFLKNPNLAYLNVTQLEVGDEIELADGSYTTVKSLIKHENQPQQRVYNFILDGDHTYYVNDMLVHNRDDCLAYSFLPKTASGEEGLFLTSVDVYFAEKHPTLGAWFEIREMDAGGGITRNQVPFTEVWLSNNQINISTDGRTNATTITFTAPVFLYNDIQYALVIHPEGSNPNLYVWACRLGQEDINTGNPVTGRPYTGTMYTTNNDLNFDIVPDLDLVCTFKRASFTTGVTGQTVIGTKPREKFLLANISSTSTLTNRYGDTYATGDKLTLTGVSAQGVNVGDTLYGNNSTANSTVLKIDGSVYYMSNTGYQTSDYLLANSGATANITTITTGRASLYKFKNGSNAKTAILSSSNGQFEIGDTILNISIPSANAQISSIEPFRYSVIDAEPAFLNFSRTTTQFEMRTMNDTGTFGSYFRVNPNENYYINDERYLHSRSGTYGSANGTNQMRVSMSTLSEFMSPVLDLGRTHTVFVDNIINANTIGETDASGGALINKYISKTITLADGQDAEDLKVILTAYRPPVSNSDIKVYAKILHAEDSDTLAQRPWIELEKAVGSEETYSSAINRNDFKEFTYSFPTSQLTGENGEVQYTSATQSIPFTGFKYYAIKIGLTSDDSSQVPRVADLRTIALQI